MKKKSFGFWSLVKLTFIAVIIGGIVFAFKYPTESKL